MMHKCTKRGGSKLFAATFQTGCCAGWGVTVVPSWGLSVHVLLWLLQSLQHDGLLGSDQWVLVPWWVTPSGLLERCFGTLAKDRLHGCHRAQEIICLFKIRSQLINNLRGAIAVIADQIIQSCHSRLTLTLFSSSDNANRHKETNKDQ